MNRLNAGSIVVTDGVVCEQAVVSRRDERSIGAFEHVDVSDLDDVRAEVVADGFDQAARRPSASRLLGQRTRNSPMSSSAIGYCCPVWFWMTSHRGVALMTSPQAPCGRKLRKPSRDGRRPGRRRASGPAKASACSTPSDKRAGEQEQRQPFAAPPSFPHHLTPGTCERPSSRCEKTGSAIKPSAACRITGHALPAQSASCAGSGKHALPTIHHHTRPAAPCTMSSFSVSCRRFLITAEGHVHAGSRRPMRPWLSGPCQLADRIASRRRSKHHGFRSIKLDGRALCHLPRIRDSRRLC